MGFDVKELIENFFKKGILNSVNYYVIEGLEKE